MRLGMISLVASGYFCNHSSTLRIDPELDRKLFIDWLRSSMKVISPPGSSPIEA